MNRLILSYEDHFLHFYFGTSDLLDCAIPDNCRHMDDSCLENCFDALVQGANVRVECHQSARSLVHYIMDHYCFVKAAGGLVSDAQNRYLLIFRQGHWDLPKGMVEPGETLRQAALREVQEETGVAHLAVDSLLLKTYHLYNKYGGWHLKQTAWYSMRSIASDPLQPQVEEDIDQAIWVPANEAIQRLGSSFASLQLLCDKLQPTRP